MHQIPFSVTEKAQVTRDLGAAKQWQQPRTYKRRAPQHVSRTRSDTQPKGDNFINFTSPCMKRQLETPRTGKSKIMLETRCRKEVSPEITDCGQSVGQEPQDGNGLGPAVVRCHETTMQNNSAHPGAVFQRASVVEDACSVNGLRRSARISALGTLSRGASQKETLPAKGNTERRRSLVELVVRPQATTNHRHGHLSKTVVDLNQCGAEPDLLTSNIRSSRSGVKRQANITIEVPPLPVDWWTWWTRARKCLRSVNEPRRMNYRVISPKSDPEGGLAGIDRIPSLTAVLRMSAPR